MITNIRDSRKRRNRWKSIQAIVEATEHDNSIDDADLAEPSDPNHYVMFDKRDDISIADAIEWASAMKCEVTLFLYDEGTN